METHYLISKDQVYKFMEILIVQYQ